MKATRAPKVAELCIETARQTLIGKRELPAVHYTRDRSGIHLSDLDGCPALPYYQKMLGAEGNLEDVPPLSDHSVLNFMKGRAFERFFAEEQERVIVDDISCTADGFQEDYGYLEVKCTAEQMDFFDPMSAHTEWIERILGYCHAYQQQHWNLVVFFIVGNMPNRLWWNIRDYGKSKEKYKGIDLRAWRLDFTEAEIGDNWIEMKRRRDLLLDCLKNETPPSKRWIDEQTPEWKHKLCQMKDVCYYHKEEILGDNADSIIEDIAGSL